MQQYILWSSCIINRNWKTLLVGWSTVKSRCCKGRVKYYYHLIQHFFFLGGGPFLIDCLINKKQLVVMVTLKVICIWWSLISHLKNSLDSLKFITVSEALAFSKEIFFIAPFSFLSPFHHHAINLGLALCPYQEDNKLLNFRLQRQSNHFRTSRFLDVRTPYPLDLLSWKKFPKNIFMCMEVIVCNLRPRVLTSIS